MEIRCPGMRIRIPGQRISFGLFFKLEKSTKTLPSGSLLVDSWRTGGKVFVRPLPPLATRMRRTRGGGRVTTRPMEEDNNDMLPPLIDYDGATVFEERIVRDHACGTLASHAQVCTLPPELGRGGGG